MNDALMHQIDLLADGELPETARAVLFEAMDATPAAWRDCAIALLERQVLSESLAPATATPAAPTAITTTRSGRLFPALLGLAAGALLTLGVLHFGFSADTPEDSPNTENAPVAIAGNEPALPPPLLFEPMLTDRGLPGYRTHEPLPEVIVHALLEAGHEVQQVEQTLQLDTPDGRAMQFPVTETQIVDMRLISL